jgi:hypothetical protein
MPFASNERLRQILSNQTNLTDLFIVKALEALLADIDPGLEDAILDELVPDAPNTQVKLFGREIGVYAGLDRTKLKAKFDRDQAGNPLTDDDVDDIFEALGVTTGTTGPMGATSPQKAAATKEDTSGESLAEVSELEDSDLKLVPAEQSAKSDESKSVSSSTTKIKTENKAAKTPAKKGADKSS